MRKNNIADLEYPALKNIAKAERRRSSVIYFTIVLCVLFFLFVAYQLLQIDRNIAVRDKRLLQTQSELVKDAQRDSRTRTEEFRRYITCIFILPIEVRTPENQLFCFRKSDLPGGRSESEFVPIEFSVDDTAVANLPDVTPNQNPQQSGGLQGGRVSSSSANSTTPNQQVQPNTSQQPPETPQREPNLIESILKVIGL